MFLSKPIRTRLATALLCVGALSGVTGCTATVTARPAVLYSHPVVYVDDAPPGIYDYPSAYYEGRPAYLVGARWYYPADGGWVYFREEPRELRYARTTRSYARVQSDAPRRRVYVEEQPRRRYEQPRETRRRRYD